ncbi:MAG: aminotransferase class V-fold PLP-dependent enzyme [Kofleriaceae bacterium]|nr:aminotransferase class V-fold PLP-dependent enzyme [Kofleriaceae bacterium]
MTTRAIVLAHRLVLEGGSTLPSSMVALVRRTLTSLYQVGVQDVAVVDGEHAEELLQRLDVGEFTGMKVQCYSNEGWRQASGSAVLAVRDFLLADSGPCLILHGERPLHKEALAALCTTQLGGHAASICVSTAADSSLNIADLSEEFKVVLRGGRGNKAKAVESMGLDIEEYDAIFTGHALVSPAALITQLEKLSNPSLEDGLSGLIQHGGVFMQMGRIAWPWGLANAAEVEAPVSAILESKQHPEYILLNPGPVNTTPRVKSAMVHHDVCHRDAHFSELMVSLNSKLRRVFRGSPEHTMCVVTGSGTAAMECGISSVVPRDAKILIVDNGAFGERMHEIARLHEMNIVHLRYAWGDQVNPDDIERAIEENPDISVIAMTAHETSVGLLNPVRAVGEICQRYDALFLVDAVSALGAEDIDVVRDHIDVCWGSANKCLHAISGAGFLSVSPRTWQKIENVKPRSYYLDLKRYKRYAEELAQTPFTPAVSAYFALDAALSEFLEDGHTARIAMYKERNQRLRKGLSALGMEPFTRTGNESHSVVTCCVPDGVTFKELYAALKVRGYVIYGCKDVLSDKFLQVANMGDLSIAKIDGFLVTIGEVISELRAEKLAVASIHRGSKRASA